MEQVPEPDPWRERQVERLVQAEGWDRPVTQRERWTRVAASLGAGLVFCVGLAVLSGHAGWWPWAVIVAVALTTISTVWFFDPQRVRSSAAQRRARAIIPTEAEAYDPHRGGSMG
jgi:hypothetical protein